MSVRNRNIVCSSRTYTHTRARAQRQTERERERLGYGKIKDAVGDLKDETFTIQHESLIIIDHLAKLIKFLYVPPAIKLLCGNFIFCFHIHNTLFKTKRKTTFSVEFFCLIFSSSPTRSF